MESDELFLIISVLIKKLKTCMCVFEKQNIRQKIIKLYTLYNILLKEEKNKKQRKYWVRPIFSAERRFAQGASDNLVQEMIIEDPHKYINYFRMSSLLFEKLLALVGPIIAKEYVIREPISPVIRLQLTLRYLASGDSMKSLSYAFRVGHNTISKIIRETCEAIWTCLKGVVFLEDKEESWKGLADEFERLWNFPNCIGAVDGKHVSIQAPSNSGSTYYNYKGYHSINLLGVSDANCCFTMVDIGAEGRQSDGGVFRNSKIGKRFEHNLFKLPSPKKLEIGGPELPYVLVADEAFPLSVYMMRPYPRRGNLNIKKKVFNYRLSRARKIVENAFGLLVARWRIYRRPIIASISNARKIIKATVVLHNFIIQNEEKVNGNNKYLHTSEDGTYTSYGVSNMELCEGQSNNNAIAIRESYATYFQETGALDFQWEKALQNDF
ncbi:putative nuclease HARBI1 isoform X1 [Temnothorax nylanderi]|uniref:putative nuclease HARBI1 isoform X1 n=1 Tax=Temnothorax nylanderi TaxID=102681 RepID=UPI003A89978E